VVDGLIRLMDADDQVSLVNIGGGDVLTMVDVVKEIIILCESSSKIIEAEEMVFLTKKGAPDLSYTKENLGWFPLVRLDEGLRKTVDYVIANKEALLFGQR
jgi:nucleoside-diphosphate-sugar epimerase